MLLQLVKVRRFIEEMSERKRKGKEFVTLSKTEIKCDVINLLIIFLTVVFACSTHVFLIHFNYFSLPLSSCTICIRIEHLQSLMKGKFCCKICFVVGKY